MQDHEIKLIVSDGALRHLRGLLNVAGLCGSSFPLLYPMHKIIKALEAENIIVRLELRAGE